MRRRRTVASAALIFAAAAACAAIANALACPERRLDWVRSAPGRSPATGLPAAPPRVPAALPAEGPAARTAAQFLPHPDKAWLPISPVEAHALFLGGGLFLDARRSAEYRAGHIAGARSIPVWEADLDARLLELANQARDPSAPIVAYCSGGDCEDSHMLAERLWGIGLNNVLVYAAGFPDWQRRGWPVRAGIAP